MINSMEAMNLARKKYGTLYDKVQLDYSYMEYIMDHVDDVSPYRKEILELYGPAKEYARLYEEAIYGQWVRLLEALLKKIEP